MSTPSMADYVTYKYIRNPYTVGSIIPLELENRTKVNARIIKVPGSFTLSCVVIILLDHPKMQDPFALKLYDRVYAAQFREDEG